MTTSSVRNFFSLFSLALLLNCTPLARISIAEAQSTIICVKKAVKLRGKRLPFRKLFRLTVENCPSGFEPIYREQGDDQTAINLTRFDGEGSRLDADFLDGVSSEQFVRQSELADTQAGNEQNISELFGIGNSLSSSLSELESRRTPRGVLSVAKEGGDFQSIAEALAALNNPSPQNPAVISIAPGEFTLDAPITIPSGVLLRGAGSSVTTLSGQVSGGSVLSSGLVLLAEGSAIERLTIINIPASDSGAAVIAEDSLSAELNIPSSFKTSINDVDIRANGNGATFAYGLLLRGASVKIRNSNIEARSNSGTAIALAISGGNSSRLRASNLKLFANGSVSGVALSGQELDAQVIVQDSEFTGNTHAISDILGLSIDVRNSLLRSQQTALLAVGALSDLRIVRSEFDTLDILSLAPPASVRCTLSSVLSSGNAVPSTCE